MTARNGMEVSPEKFSPRITPRHSEFEESDSTGSTPTPRMPSPRIPDPSCDWSKSKTISALSFPLPVIGWSMSLEHGSNQWQESPGIKHALFGLGFISCVQLMTGTKAAIL